MRDGEFTTNIRPYAVRVGRAMGDVSIHILHPQEDGIGDIAVRSPSMFTGYLDGDPPPLVDGHFLTGDLGYLDSVGELVLVGRSRLLIDTGGLKVNPLEIEAVLLAHPSVADCVVVALPQSETVNRIRAIVVPRGGAIDVEQLRAFVRDRLASYKVPRVFEVRDALPRTAAGKVARGQLD